MTRYINNAFALMTAGVVSLFAGKDAALHIWSRYKR